jgi:hypothetical protein
VIGTPAAIMVRRASALSPIFRIISELGPMKRILQVSQISAKCAFSDRKP